MKNQDAITIKLGIFSGRPNPEMKLESSAAAEFAELIRPAVGKEQIHPPPPAKLGEFYGFSIQVPPSTAKELRLPEQINVHSGVVTVSTGEKQEHWRDVAGIERFLIRSAYEQGLGEQLQLVNISRPD